MNRTVGSIFTKRPEQEQQPGTQRTDDRSGGVSVRDTAFCRFDFVLQNRSGINAFSDNCLLTPVTPLTLNQAKAERTWKEKTEIPLVFQHRSENGVVATTPTERISDEEKYKRTARRPQGGNEISDGTEKMRAVSHGGLALVHRVAVQSGLCDVINAVQQAINETRRQGKRTYFYLLCLTKDKTVFTLQK